MTNSLPPPNPNILECYHPQDYTNGTVARAKCYIIDLATSTDQSKCFREHCDNSAPTEVLAKAWLHFAKVDLTDEPIAGDISGRLMSYTDMQHIYYSFVSKLSRQITRAEYKKIIAGPSTYTGADKPYQELFVGYLACSIMNVRVSEYGYQLYSLLKNSVMPEARSEGGILYSLASIPHGARTCNAGACDCSDLEADILGIVLPDKVLAVRPVMPRVQTAGSVAFGRFTLKVDVAASCNAFAKDPYDCSGVSNCTTFVTPGTKSGLSDYDMMPPKQLRHSVSSHTPSVNCFFSDLWTLNIFAKVYQAAKTGTFVDFWVGVKAVLSDTDLERVDIHRASYSSTDKGIVCDGTPTVIWYSKNDARQFIAPDAVHHDVARYGNILDYSTDPPQLGAVHHLFYGDSVEVWAPQVDEQDTYPSKYDMNSVTYSGCATWSDNITCQNPCSYVKIEFSGAYTANRALYLLSAEASCCAVVARDLATYRMQLGPLPTLVPATPTSTFTINGLVYLAPAAPKITTDWAETSQQIATLSGWFDLLLGLLTFFGQLVSGGPHAIILLLWDHLLDISAVILLLVSYRLLRFDVMCASIVYWYIRVMY